ncbi:hypothetical protein HMPREF9466_02857 [Fusobacterium necrophorum subsp. funduliforme 1_1_36S]|nr:hypothetical protein HMPREF9466_02857 [Fusobacterium necrophorum subsp. funduliforme 1_1_36S]
MTNFTVFWATFLSALYRVDYFFFERLCHESLQAEKINFFYQYFPKEVVESFFYTVTKFGEGYLELFFILIFYLFSGMINRNISYIKNMLGILFWYFFLHK